MFHAPSKHVTNQAGFLVLAETNSKRMSNFVKIMAIWSVVYIWFLLIVIVVQP